jgi:hypothetical protein
MTFEEQLKHLCQKIVACKSDEEAVELARRMQALMHARVEELRSNLIALPTIGPTIVDEKKTA